jgi:hypothetical protein
VERQEKLWRLGALLVALAAMVRVFDRAFLAFRLVPIAVPPDSLLHYNAFLWWTRFGDSPRGFTLTPSPYFLDLVMQLPLSVAATDFEHFSYRLSELYALLFLATTYVLLRYALRTTRLVAFVIASAGTAGFYALAPWGFYEHAFMANHTSLVPASLAVVAVVFALFRPEARPRRLAPLLYALAVFACVFADPFTIGTYCVPACGAVTLLLGTQWVTWRRLVCFVGLTGVATVAGLVAVAAVARYVWPIRGDNYVNSATKSFHMFVRMVKTADGVQLVAVLCVVATIATTALFVHARRKSRLNGPALFMLAFIPLSLIACTILPIKRGAFDDAYALRYVTMPWLLITTFYAALVVLGVRALALRWSRTRSLPSWLAWAAGPVLAACALATCYTAHGPVKMFGNESSTGAMLRCFKNAEKNAGLQDGLATVYVARYVNAARHARKWKSPYVVVEVYPSAPPMQEPRESNVLWYNDDVYRQGRAKINWVATHHMSPDAMNATAAIAGPPDRIIECPQAIDKRPDQGQLGPSDGKPSFEIWIWDREESQRKLGELMTRSNIRSAFSPVLGKTRMPIDLEYGMAADGAHSKLVDGHRIWERGVHVEGSMAFIRVFWVPSGRYRIDLDLASVPHGPNATAVAELVIEQDHAKEPIARFPIAPGNDHPSFMINIDNFGGATSGDLIWMNLYTRDADRLDLSSMTMTLVEPKGIDPFRIFR